MSAEHKCTEHVPIYVELYPLLIAADGFELKKLPKVKLLRNNKREGVYMFGAFCDFVVGFEKRSHFVENYCIL